ncbi:MAG: DUF222 domain-containing protein [Actinomycetota bacterium]|nr:DUF222 domain-containing protein [Actinomycetota bacterium]
MFAIEAEVVSVPAGLDEMEPGPVLAAVLSSIDVNEVSGYDRVTVLRAQQKMASHFQAQVYEAIAAVSNHMLEIEDDPRSAGEAAAAEIGVALRLTRRAADVELTLAVDLQRRLPATWRLLATGAIDLRRAKTIDHGTAHLTDAVAQEVDRLVAEQAPRLTTGQLRARLARLCIEADPDHAEGRYRHAVAERRVVTEATGDGTANLLGMDLPPNRVAAATRRINALARSLRIAGETRTMDQLRADVLLDLLNGTNHTGKTSSGGSGVVDLHVDLDTLAGLTEHPGELAGYGPVIADIARQIALEQIDGEWRYTVTHPHTGQPVANGVTRRRPTTAQRRYVETRDRTCTFPGCRAPATDCDLDHRTPHSEGGPTHVENLGPLCRHHHNIHHHHGWTYQPLEGGDYQWTSPLGHTYTTSGTPP